MYFGSVRFFKNLILLTIIILIAIPTALSSSFYFALQEERDEVVALQQQIDEQGNAADPSAGGSKDLPYQSLYPDFYAPDGYHATEDKSNVIYLTFDDGPSANTNKILDVLAEEKVKGTFFVIGKNEPDDLPLMKRIVEEGHTIGMHSYSHNYSKIYTSVEAFLDDMYPLFVQIRETTGVTPAVFRFPGGSINSYNGAIYQEIVAEMIRRGFVPWDWNISAQDSVTKSINAGQIVNNIANHATGVARGAVLMHDNAAKTSTANAVQGTIKQLRAMGFELDKITPEIKPILFTYKE